MPTPVFLLAAGLGSRLRPLTDLLPKPLLPVGDRPALSHVLERVRGLGGPIVANAHHRAGDLRAFVEKLPGGPVLLSHEPDLLGTAGGLARSAPLLGGGDVLIWNGDILANLDARSLVGAHTDAVATLAVEPRARGEGNVGVDAAGRIVRLRSETTAPGEAVGGLFLGIHVVGGRLRGSLPVKGCLVGDVYLPALRRGETLRVFDVTGVVWQDIGTVDDYRKANVAWVQARGGESFVGGGARISEGVTLEESVIGERATVEGEGGVVRSVVWPGARAMAPLIDAVVTGGG